MQEHSMPERIIAIDIGNSLTRSCLLCVVEGRYRLAAVSQFATTLRNLDIGAAEGVLQTLLRLQQTTSIPLLEPSGQAEALPRPLPGNAISICSSAAAPLRVVILALTPTFSLSAARLACQMPFVRISGSQVIRLPDKADNVTSGYRLDTDQPDVILLGGGFDAATNTSLEIIARRLVRAFELSSYDQRPRIILAANQAAQRNLVSILNSAFDLRPVRNLCPDADTIDIAGAQQELLKAYEELKIVGLPGYDQLTAITEQPIVSSWRALGHALAYLPDKTHLGGFFSASAGVFILSMSGGYHLAGMPFPESTTSQPGGSGSPSESAPQGLAAATGVSEKENPHALPVEMSALAAAQQTLSDTNRTIHPFVEYGYLNPPGNADLIVVHVEQRANARNRAQTLLATLNMLEPVIATKMMFYQGDLLPQLGAVASGYPQTAELLLQAEMQEFGISIAPVGVPHNEKPALEIRITRITGAEERRVVPGGCIQRFTFPPKELVRIEVRCKRGWQFAHGTRSFVISTACGNLGLFIDTRGRPLVISRKEPG